MPQRQIQAPRSSKQQVLLSQSNNQSAQGTGRPRWLSPGDIASIFLILEIILLPFIWPKLNTNQQVLISLIVASILEFFGFIWQVSARKPSLILYWLREGFHALREHFRSSKNRNYDVFIYWDPADLIWKEWIDGTLENEGYRVVSPPWNGESFSSHLSEAERAAKCVMIVWSDAFKNKLSKNSAEEQAEFEKCKSNRKGWCVQIDVHRGELLGRNVVSLAGFDGMRAKDMLVQVVKSKLGRPTSRHPQKKAFHFPGANWNVPGNFNPFFKGRTEILNNLYQAFIGVNERHANEFVRPQALTGLANIGKTEIATRYAYQNRSHYRYVFWIKVIDRDSFVHGYSHIARVADLKGDNQQALLDSNGNPFDGQSLIQRVRRWLIETSDVLLVLDQCDNLQGNTIEEFLPNYAKSHILLTTCAASVASIANLIEVKDLPHNEGASVLLRYAEKKVEDPDWGAELNQATEILKEVIGPPLALVLLGKEIAKRGCSVSDFLSHISEKDERKKILTSMLQNSSNQSIADRWLAQLDSVQRKNSFAARLLVICSFFHHKKIPVEDILPALTALDSSRFPLANKGELEQAIADLRCYSLVRRIEEKNDGTTLSKIKLGIHPLVSFVIKELFIKDDAERREMAELAVKALDRAFQGPNGHGIQKYILHAEVCADLIQDYNMEFEEAADLLTRLGQYWQAHEDISKSLEYFELAASKLKALSQPITQPAIGGLP